VIIAITGWETTAWVATLIVGVVVLLVVLALLEALRRSVKSLSTGVDQVLLAGGHLAQNTWTAQLLSATRARGLDLVALLRGQKEGSS